ncbi:pitrilysin family protein [Maricaulis sp.]|uniref:M16 family metallopeptidase n=1 Tax=Maricaulis sp. TaxID=1486257 RepID=UPI0025C02FAD|nr:pitrilysin family protein [Maricaulis sp.]
MKSAFRALAGLAGLVCASLPGAAAMAQTAPAPTDGLHIPLRYERLDNGLRVVLAEDHTVPTATVAVYYGVGYRNEPRGMTGFAHLFEHLFFAGSANLPEPIFYYYISGMGGIANGSTRLDFTNYYGVVPASALDAYLWAEADRMAAPTINAQGFRRERDVVRNEIFVNVGNQPYGDWTWIDLPMVANENWHNAHNFYGDLSDLDAATVADARAFFEQYYTPRNAVLVVAGSFDSDATLATIDQFFGDIPSGPDLPEIDVSEPPQLAEKRSVMTDPLATLPGLAIAYHMPERGTPEYFAMILIDQILVRGGDARLRERLVDELGFGSDVSGGINLLGNVFNYDGPMLWTSSIIHDDAVAPDIVLEAFDGVIDTLRSETISDGTLASARSKFLAEFYSQLDYSTRFGVVDLLASFALFDDDPDRINHIEDGFEQVTPALILETARTWLRPENRTVLELVPGDGRPAAAPAAEEMRQ